MKTITGLNERLVHFDDAAPEAIATALPTFKKMILNVLGGSAAANGEEAIAMYEIGMRMRALEDVIELKDEDHLMILSKLRPNSLGWLAHYHAQVLLKVLSAQEAKQ